MKMRFFIFLLALLPPPSQAQTSRVFTLLIRSGPDLIKLLVEKRADLTIGIVSGTVVTLGDHALGALFGESKAQTLPPLPLSPGLKLPKCSSLNPALAACSDNFTLPNEKPITLEDIDTMIETEHYLENPEYPRPLIGQKLEFFKGTSLVKGKTEFTPTIDAHLNELKAWWSAEGSGDVAKYQEYLQRFPHGEHALLANVRIATLGSNPPKSSQMPCSSSESEILAPIRELHSAVNSKDIQRYADQWYDEGLYRDNRVQLNKFQLVAERTNAFAKWLAVSVELQNWTVMPGPLGEATVADTFTVDIVTNGGQYLHDQVKETYHLACAVNGRWRILENVAYLP
jgi:hypothetical protein